MRKKGAMICAILCLSIIAVAFVQSPSQYTLYVISDMGQGGGTTMTLEAYSLDPSGIILTKVGQHNLPYRDLGTVGLALDKENKRVFLTWEDSGVADICDATNFNNLGTVATAATNLSGILVDETTDTLYMVDRGKTTIYMYDTVTFAAKGTGTVAVGAGGTWGIAFDSTNQHLYVTDTSNTVSVFDATSMPGPATLVTTHNVGSPAVGISVDSSNPANPIIYTTGWNSSAILTKYDTISTVTTTVPGLVRPAGVWVHPTTQTVYITDDTPRIQVYDAATMTLQNTIPLPAGWTPTDLLVGEIAFGFVPSPPTIQTTYNPNEICPLSQYRIEKAEDLVAVNQELIDKAKAEGKDTTECEELLEQAKEALEMAKMYSTGKNCCAANYWAVKAMNLLYECKECVESL